MPNRNEYNGWINYETWLVALWIDNDESMHWHWNERISDLIDDLDDDIAYRLQCELEEWHDETSPDCSGVFADLIRAGLSEVEWRDVAIHLLDASEEYRDHLAEMAASDDE